jgi:3-oxoacyl-[acyl-carrier-protein] synthase-3
VSASGARRFASIAATGSVLPERVVPNSYFESLVETTDEWIRQRTGIRERHFAAEDETTSDLAATAGRRALETAGTAPEQVDLIVVATLSPDTPIPATAVHVQRKLGIGAPAFDVNAACAGFSYAISTGTAMVEAGNADTVLVIGAEVLSRFLDFTDRTVCILFGDGAGAVLLKPSDAPGVIDGVLGADGTTTESLFIPAGGSRMPASMETVAAHDHSIRMPRGSEVFHRAVTEMAASCRELLEKNGFRSDEVDLLVPHQANARIMSAVAERLNVRPDAVVSDVETVGNTSAASIPLALDRAWRAGRIAPGGLVLLTSFGAGLSWGATLVRWTASSPTPLS